MTAHRVFVSYSHDSPEHLAAVLALVQRLRDDGVDAWIDRFEPAPAQGWARWTRDQIDGAAFVLLVCTKLYQQRFYGRSPDEQGRGAAWEASILNAEIYRHHGQAGRCVPVVLAEGDRRFVPDVLSSHTLFELPEDYPRLFDLLTAQLSIRPNQLGNFRRHLPPAEPLWQDDSDLHTVEVPAWFDGVVHQRAIVLYRGRPEQRWSLEVLERLPLLRSAHEAPKGAALLNLVKDGQHVAALMAVAPLGVAWLAATGTLVRQGDVVATVHGPVRDPLVAWNQVAGTYRNYLAHSPPLGYRVWTRFVGEAEKCIRISDAKLVAEGAPTRISMLLEPMKVPPGIFQIRSPISGRVNLRENFPPRLQKGDFVAVVANSELSLELSCNFEGDLRKLQVETGDLVEAGQVLFDLTSDVVILQSDVVGTFFLAESPHWPPLIQVGDRVHEGQLLFTYEFIKLKYSYHSPVTGTIIEILVQDGEKVEYGQPLVRIDCT